MTGTAVRPSSSLADPESGGRWVGAADPVPSHGPLALLRRPLVACLVLLALYATCTLALNDPRGTLGTDTGSKLATLHVMDQKGTLVPEIGYWAAAADPKGDVHPIFYSFKVNGTWVNVTTLPMIYAAYPLFELGGDRAVLLIPMLGATLCALAARSLARRLGRGSGWSAFGVMGLVSPVAIYALDFWEHSLGLALMLWGVVWLLRVLDDDRAFVAAFVAGLLFGAAATMRTEALVYLVVCGAVTCIVHLWRSRSLGGAFLRGAALLAGAAVPLIVNDAFERLMLGGTIRASRAAGTAAEVGVSASVRVQEALTTFVGVNRFEHTADYVLGALIVGCLALAVWSFRRAEDQIPLLASTRPWRVPCSSCWSASPVASASCRGCWSPRRSPPWGSSSGGARTSASSRSWPSRHSRWYGCSNTPAVPARSGVAATRCCQELCSSSPRPSCSKGTAPRWWQR